MNTSAKSTLMASLVGSAAGTGAWLLGMGELVWPAHPQVAVLLLTIVCTVVVMQVWPNHSPAAPKNSG